MGGMMGGGGGKSASYSAAFKRQNEPQDVRLTGAKTTDPYNPGEGRTPQIANGGPTELMKMMMSQIPQPPGAPTPPPLPPMGDGSMSANDAGALEAFMQAGTQSLPGAGEMINARRGLPEGQLTPDAAAALDALQQSMQAGVDWAKNWHGFDGKLGE